MCRSFFGAIRIGVALCVASFAFALLCPVYAFADGSVKIHVMPFDYSDAIVVESDGHFGLIDAGEDSDYPSGSDSRYPLRSGTTIGAGVEQELIAYMRSIGVTKDNLDFFIGTHPHSDHIGGADEVIREFHPKTIYTPYYDDAINTDPRTLWDNQYVYDHLVAAAEWACGPDGYNAKFIQFLGDENDPPEVDPLRVGDSKFSLGSARIEVLNYSTLYLKTKVPNANYFSYGVRVVAPNGRSAFIAGDINNFTDGEKAPGDEDELAKILANVDFLKMGHHGGWGSNTPAYLRAILRSTQGSSSPVAMQNGEYSILPLETVQMLNTLGVRYFNTRSVKLAGQKALVAELADGGVLTNLDDSGLVLQTRGSYPWAYYYDGGIPVLWHRGWLNTSGRWQYFEDDGSLAMGWRYINGAWYHLSGADGVMQTGWLEEGSSWYYLNSSGALFVGNGWERIGGKWYYYYPGNADGALATGWIYDGYAWYYLDPSSCWMVTGWARVDGAWYYLAPSGAMQTGWQRIGGTWYFLDGSGAMAEGWRNLGGTWYYLQPGSGAMATGWAQVDDTWYYLNKSGAMKTGWLRDGRTWYYLDGSGAMVTGEQVIDGTPYTFDASGAMM